jgi:hypothetical protein
MNKIFDWLTEYIVFEMNLFLKKYKEMKNKILETYLDSNSWAMNVNIVVFRINIHRKFAMIFVNNTNFFN